MASLRGHLFAFNGTLGIALSVGAVVFALYGVWHGRYDAAIGLGLFCGGGVFIATANALL